MDKEVVSAMALGDPEGTAVANPICRAVGGTGIVIRISGPVGCGKTHVAETIREALERRYGASGSVIDITLTDIQYDSVMGNDTSPPKGTSFKIIEDINKR